MKKIKCKTCDGTGDRISNWADKDFGIWYACRSCNGHGTIIVKEDTKHDLDETSRLVEYMSTLLNRGDFETVDAMLLIPARMFSSLGMVCMVRINYPARDKLKNWLLFRHDAQNESDRNNYGFNFPEG